MATSDNSQNPKATPASPQDSSTLPAQHVWLAGLGAMAKAQEQGSKAIEALVNDGLAFQRKSQAEAQQRLHEATERLSHMASGFGPQATGRVDKLEHLFEDRVAKALHRLGMPSLLDIQMLTERVAQLEAQVAALSQAGTAKPAPRSTTAQSKTSPTTQSATAKSAKAVKAATSTQPAGGAPAKTRRSIPRSTR
jgi:poly(hydroxyalkanoate) granule-associated protein